MKFEAIDDFLKKVKQATSSGSRDIRMSIQDATLLTISLADLLARIDNSDKASSPNIQKLDGGSFKDYSNPS